MIKKKFLNSIMKPSNKYKIKRMDENLIKMLPGYAIVSNKLRAYLRKLIYEENYFTQDISSHTDHLWNTTIEVDNKNIFKVSVIVPNYNHEKYLRERLQSIYKQTYKNFEVILLDDCSSDNSALILEEYANKYSQNTKVYQNENNSGSVFKQWEKGIRLATGDLIWIAESDDFCDNNFLAELVPFFCDEAVMLAFAHSKFIKNKQNIYTTEEYLQEFGEINCNIPFKMTANEIVKNGFAIKNVIVNVSSVVFRNIGDIDCDIKEEWNRLQLCGDWIFYLSILKGGVIAYTNKTTNYYRIHEKSTSLKIQKTEKYYKEFETIAKYIVRNYSVDMDLFKKQKEMLYKHYRSFHSDGDISNVDEFYNLNNIKNESKKKLPNIIMCGYSMIMGGGETYPIVLANALKGNGATVTFFDFNMAGRNINVRKMLDSNIPLVNVKKLKNVISAIEQLDADIIHSHHGNVDNVISLFLQNMFQSKLKLKQVITLHGMYEAIRSTDLENLLKNVSKTCKQFVYTANKNLSVFKCREDIDYKKFIYIKNGLDRYPINPINRETLGISNQAFVLCLVSRAIPEKGWEEAIKAVQCARKQSSMDIHLILIGSGEIYDKYLNNTMEYIHILGERNNIRDYFACSDVGILPSRFKGESYPLVIIDCLFSDRPVIASNIGEIKNQLLDEDGNIAGVLFDLIDWKVPINKLADIICKVAIDHKLYDILKARTKSASKKFYIENIAKEYLKVYKKVLTFDDCQNSN